MWQRIDVDRVCAFISFITDVDTLLTRYQVYQLIAVLTDYHRPVVACDIVPFDSVSILVVHHGKAGLIVELLQSLNGYSNVVIRLDRPLFDSFIVVWLRFSSLSSRTPESFGVRGVCGWDSVVVSTSPEPSVHIDGLKMGSIAALILKIALASACVDGSNIVSFHDFLEHFELSWAVERHEVHASVPAKVSSVEPIPVLKLVPRFSPRKEIVVIAHFHVCFSFYAFIDIRPVEQWFAVRSNPGWFLG